MVLCVGSNESEQLELMYALDEWDELLYISNVFVCGVYICSQRDCIPAAVARGAALAGVASSL